MFVYFLEVRSAESFIEIRILIRRLHFLIDGRVVFYFNEFVGHCVGSEVGLFLEQPVKPNVVVMQTATTNEGAIRLLKTLFEYAPEELAAAKQAASRRQEQEREQKHSRVNSSNKFKGK